MKELFQYLLRGKRGLASAILTPVITMICFTAAYLIVGILPKIYILNDAESVYGYQFTLEERAEILCFLSGTAMEFAAMIAAAICFWGLCARIFQCGTANGTSRSSVIKTTLFSVPLVAVPVTLLCETIRLVLEHCTPFVRPDSVYYVLCHRGSSGNVFYNMTQYVYGENIFDSCTKMRLPELDARSVLCFFVLLCILLAWVCGLYALRRRFGRNGVIIGICVFAMLISLAHLPMSLSQSDENALSRLFFNGQNDIVDWLHGQFVLMHPNTAVFALLAVILIALPAGAYMFLLRRAGIKPTV